MFSIPFVHTKDEKEEFLSLLNKNKWDVALYKPLDYGASYICECRDAEYKGCASCRFIIYEKKNGCTSSIVIEKGDDVFFDFLKRQEKSLSHNAKKEENVQSFVHRPTLEIPDYDERVGSDESGKGDLFGPLVVAAVCLSKKDELLLAHLPISDSKKHTDSVNMRTKEVLVDILPSSKYSIRMLEPSIYNNEYTRYKNINTILSILHTSAIEDVLSKNPSCTHIVVDQFTSSYVMEKSLSTVLSEKMSLLQTPKAERDMAVGAASILARSTFLEKLNEYSERLGVEINAGASLKVQEEAKKILKEKGEDTLKTIAKTHFSCYPKNI